MNPKRWLATLVLATAILASVPSVRACPLCADAIANSNAATAEEERNDFPLAMNRSIYLMISVPYLALGIVGFLIYRGVRRNADYLREQGQLVPTDGAI